MMGGGSPRIEQLEWGRVRVADWGEFKDAKLWPGGARAWDWRETGTRHVPGIQPADVEELLDHGARELVLSRGMWLALQVGRATRDLLEERGVAIHVLESRKAVAKYNELIEKIPAGALIHSTC